YGFDLEPPEDDPANLESGGTTSTTPTGGYRRDYTWNERNLLIKSDDKLNTVIYRYGDDGQRALKFTQQSNSETLYFNNFYSVHQVAHEPNHEHGLRVSKHIFVGNSRLVTAMTHADNNGDTTEQTEKRYYYHADHLQSAQFITNAKGEQYEHIEYTPYGELWIEETAPGIDKLPFRFTGKEMDEETGLYYYGARYLDPKYSRWLSGDPALNDYIPKAPIDDEAKKHNENLPGMGGIYNTINLHVYHYAGNNPVKYTDPDGREIENLDPSQEAKLLENIINVAGTGFYFENNKLKFDSSSKASGKYSQTARDILIAGIASSKTTYVLPASPEKIQELLPDAYGELGFARRVSGEPGNTVGVYMIDVPTTQAAIDYLNNTFNCTPSEADELGFIHEVLGHAICDMGIPGYNSKTDIMKIERKIREELGWKGVSRSLKSEEADLTGLFFRIRK
ncbi:RHS repeat-associated core domain-containing protein, partial [Treponema denticola ATCC 35404]